MKIVNFDLRFINLAIARIYLLVLGLGYVSAGWLLAAFQVSGFVWIGTLGIILYLAKVGADAIVVARRLGRGDYFCGSRAQSLDTHLAQPTAL